MKGWKWFTITMLAIVVGMSLYSYFRKKPPEKIVDVGYTMKARRNPLLAAEKFLKKRDIDAETIAHFNPGKLPNTYYGGVLVASFNNIPLDGPDFDALTKWVQRGNVLICGNTRREVTDSVGMKAKTRHFFGLISQTPINTSVKVTDTLTLQDKAGLFKDYSVKMELRHKIKPVPHAKVVYDSTGHCLTYSLPQMDGLVIVINDMSVFYNDDIKSEDHALLLEDLISNDSKGSPKVQMIYRSSDNDSAWKWIWRNCKVFLLITLLFIALFILRKSVRFGPTLPEPEPVRRQLMEHIAACGKYNWNSPEGAHKLLTSLRLNVMEKLQRSHPMIEKLSKKAMVQELSEMTGISTTLLHRALVPNQQEITEFIDIVKTLQEVRNTL